MYIAEGNLEAGVTFLVAVEDAIEQLAQFPLIGRDRQFTDKRFQSVRMWQIKSFENYLIFYTVEADSIEVIRVLHGARDIEDLFG